MSWCIVPHDIAFMIFKELASPKKLVSKDAWGDITKCMLVSRGWKEAMEFHILMNTPFQDLLRFGSDKLALAQAKRSLPDGFIPLNRLQVYLVWATKNRALLCMGYLIKRNAPFTLDTQFIYPAHGQFGTPLSVAAETECLPGIQLLLRSQRIFAMYEPQYLHFALAIAVQKRNTLIMESLIVRGAAFKQLIPTADLPNVVEEKIPPLSYAIECGDMDLLKYLLRCIDREEYDHPDFRHFVSPLIRAVRNKDLIIAHNMMELGWSANPLHKHQVLPLGEAAALGYIDVIEFLVDWSANIHETDTSGRAALDRALIHEHEEAVDLILSYFPRIDELTFRSVISSGSVQGLRWLLKKGEYMSHHLLGYGLCEAISQDNEQLVRVFLEQRCVRLLNDRTGRHALICAIERNNISIIRMLLAGGKDPAVKWHIDNLGPEISAVALHTAIIHQNIEIVQLLLAHGAKPNIPSSNASAALFSALPMGNIDLVRLLLMYGANVHALSDTGETVIDAALRAGSDEAVAAVIEYGGDKGRLPADVLSRVKLIEERNEAMRREVGLGGELGGAEGEEEGGKMKEGGDEGEGEMETLVEFNGEFSSRTAE